MFIESAIIENTKEAREWLENLSYTNIKGAGQDYIVTFSPSAVYFISNDNYPSFRIALNKEKAIDCRGNLQLFKAIIALRDDNDYMQWFFTDKAWFLCEKHDIRYMIDVPAWILKGIKKATAEELIEHFKQKI